MQLKLERIKTCQDYKTWDSTITIKISVKSYIKHVWHKAQMYASSLFSRQSAILQTPQFSLVHFSHSSASSSSHWPKQTAHSLSEISLCWSPDSSHSSSVSSPTIFCRLELEAKDLTDHFLVLALLFLCFSASAFFASLSKVFRRFSSSLAIFSFLFPSSSAASLPFLQFSFAQKCYGFCTS